MGPIEKDLHESREEIKAGKWDWNNYLGFIIDHGAPVYECTENVENTLLALLDELEEEHKTDIPQPVDADGVPWTGEEEVCTDNYGSIRNICAIRYSLGPHKSKGWYIYSDYGLIVPASACRHVKPKRTLDEIVKDVNAAMDIDKIGNVKVTEELLLDLTELHQYFADNAGDKS